MSEESVTTWIGRLVNGDPRAPQVIWERYSEELIGFACRRLRGRQSRVEDEEDVVLSAMNSFLNRAANAKFHQLHDRSDLRKLLFTITLRKAAKSMRRDFRSPHGSDEKLDALAGEQPGPEFLAAMADSFESMFSRLDDVSLRTIALKKLEGFSNEEIAELQDCAVRTVERKLERIRTKWSRDLGARP